MLHGGPGQREASLNHGGSSREGLGRCAELRVTLHEKLAELLFEFFGRLEPGAQQIISGFACPHHEREPPSRISCDGHSAGQTRVPRLAPSIATNRTAYG